MGTNKIKDEYTKINTGFDRVEADINDANSRITAVDNRVDTIITTPIDGEAAAQEIVDARGDFSTIGARMTNIEEDIGTHIAEYATYEGKRLYILNPYKNGGALSLKGQLHCHSTNSDGTLSPAEVVTVYKNAGYDFLTITDHDYITPDPKVAGITWIGTSVEETVRRHIVAYDVTSQSTSRNLQDIIDWHRNNSKMCSIAHPRWNAHYDMDKHEMQSLNGYNFIEVYNPAHILSAEEQWDYALSAGKKVFAIAVDDMHVEAGMNKGYVIVKCNENTKSAILESLRTGNFYASNGNDIEVSLSNNILTASSTALSNIKFIGRDGIVLQENNGVTTANYTIKGDERYIRAVSIRVSDGKCAWAQPIFVDVIGSDDRAYPEIIRSSISNIHRQAIINSNFDIWQRGTSFTNPIGYTADRWKVVYDVDGGSLPTLVHTRENLIIADNIKNAFYYYRITTDGAGANFGGGSYYTLRQGIENGVKLLCCDGDKVTISFWARSSIPNKKLALLVSQRYGTGGSPSNPNRIGDYTWTLTEHWQKFVVSFPTVSLVNKVFGTNGDDYLDVIFSLQWGANSKPSTADAAETFGGAGTIDISQVQLCAGDAELPYMPKSYAEELRDCQRYYQRIRGLGTLGTYVVIGADAAKAFGALSVPVPMRKRPSISSPNYALIKLFNGTSYFDVTKIDIIANSDDFSRFNTQITSSGLTANQAYTVAVMQDGVIELDAEL